MKNDGDPRLASGRFSDPAGRDTRLDPADAAPDATERAVPVTDTEAISILTPVSPQAPPPPPPVIQEVIYDAPDVRVSEAPSSEEFRSRAPRRRVGWPFLPLAPFLVVVVGLAV